MSSEEPKWEGNQHKKSYKVSKLPQGFVRFFSDVALSVEDSLLSIKLSKGLSQPSVYGRVP